MKSNFKVKRWECPRYRRFVSSLPCCLCQSPDASDPHHYQREGAGVMGGKVGDENVIPLCHTHHQMLHQYGRLKWQDWQKDPEVVIAQTQSEWLARGNKALWLAPQLN